MYGALTLVIEAGWIEICVYQLRHLLQPFLSCYKLIGGDAQEQEEWPEDEDVSREFYRIQDGKCLITEKVHFGTGLFGTKMCSRSFTAFKMVNFSSPEN